MSEGKKTNVRVLSHRRGIEQAPDAKEIFRPSLWVSLMGKVQWNSVKFIVPEEFTETIAAETVSGDVYIDESGYYYVTATIQGRRSHDGEVTQKSLKCHLAGDYFDRMEICNARQPMRGIA